MERKNYEQRPRQEERGQKRIDQNPEGKKGRKKRKKSGQEEVTRDDSKCLKQKEM
ncbi:MAG: hypothetical protein GX751_03805 [Desulfuromonadaceae bacterium]|nr:hypothetical protein [Desulfuromonadaceae bacterium]